MQLKDEYLNISQVILYNISLYALSKKMFDITSSISVDSNGTL